MKYPKSGAYGPSATCRHGIHPYDCYDGCDPHEQRATELYLALADLLRQVNSHVERYGEADFYIGNTLAALGKSNNPVHIQTLRDLHFSATPETAHEVKP